MRAECKGRLGIIYSKSRALEPLNLGRIKALNLTSCIGLRSGVTGIKLGIHANSKKSSPTTNPSYSFGPAAPFHGWLEASHHLRISGVKTLLVDVFKCSNKMVLAFPVNHPI